MMTAEGKIPGAGSELKYCEFCGALWLRPRGADQVYCGRCAAWIESELPLYRGRASVELRTPRSRGEEA